MKGLVLIADAIFGLVYMLVPAAMIWLLQGLVAKESFAESSYSFHTVWFFCVTARVSYHCIIEKLEMEATE